MCRIICLEKRLLSERFPGQEKQMRNDTCFIYLFTFRIFLKGRFVGLQVNVNSQRLGNECSCSGLISMASNLLSYSLYFCVKLLTP